MKFFKCHANKFKDDEVLFMGEQFTEIGPDAFAQTDFQMIIVSPRVTAIRDHAFTGVSNCTIYIPSGVEEVDLLAFEGMGTDNTIFCERNSLVHKRCVELDLQYDDDVDACLEAAETIRRTSKAKTERVELLLKEEAERIKSLAIAEAMEIKTTALTEAAQIKTAALEEAVKIKTVASKKAMQLKQEAETEAVRIKNAALTEANNIKRAAQIEASRIRTQSQARPAYSQPSRPAPKKNPNEKYQMRGLDEFDDELKKIKEEESPKRGWGFFAGPF